MSATPRLVLSNQVNVSNKFDVAIPYKGQQVMIYANNPDGTDFSQQILFNNVVTPNMATTLISRNFRVMYDVAISYDTTDANAPQFAGVKNGSAGILENQNVDTCLRAFPLQSISDNTQLTINSQNLSMRSRVLMDALCHTLDKSYLDCQAAECPTRLDKNMMELPDVEFLGNISYGANWNAAGNTGTIGNYTYTLSGASPVAADVGSVRAVKLVGRASLKAGLTYTYQGFVVIANEFAGAAVMGPCYVSHAQSNQVLSIDKNSDGVSRGSFMPVSSTIAGNIQTVTFNVVENLLLSPLTQHDRETGLANVNTLSLLFTYSSIKDMLYSARTALPAGLTVSINSPRLILNYINVNPQIVKIPSSVSYSFEQPIIFPKVQSSTNPTTPAQMQSDTLRLNAVPSKFFIFVRPKTLSGRTNQDTTSFLSLGQNSVLGAIAGVSIDFGTRSGLLTTASNQDLYRMSVRNGYNGSWEEWRRNTVYIIDPCADFGIDPKTEALPLEQFAVNLTVRCYVNSYSYDANNMVVPTALLPELNIVSLYKGVVSITPDSLFNSLAVITPNEMSALLNSAPKDGSMVSDEHIDPTINGSGLFDTAKSVLGQMASAVQSPLGQQILNQVARLK